MDRKALGKYSAKMKCQPLEPGEPVKLYERAIVIPACAELEFLPETLESLKLNPKDILDKTLIIVVVNNSIESPDGKKSQNIMMLEDFRKGNHPHNFFWMDLASAGREIDAKCGVGGARKAGMDTALKYLVQSDDSLIFSLDADTLVEGDYISSGIEYFKNNPASPGAVFDFNHRRVGDVAIDTAIGLYESFIRNYADELKAAGSPYGYHVLGSAIVCRALSYMRCGGMRERNGGEDFYFLQALRKLGIIGGIVSSCVHPSPRPSDRVPFGTGPKVSKIALDGKLAFYNSAIFELLHIFLKHVNGLSVEEMLVPEFLVPDSMPEEIKSFLAKYSFCGSWKNIIKNTPHEKRRLVDAFNCWFDAFRTLKFVHFCENEFSDKYSRV
ncbi:MAG: hypothetical protein A2020_01295 [Lentisphaerae bacterium GWF2_45_14]|nr:MAG: hypothetical protein A2020_01295 [Lentisphaerae bacterium GWF2_45_14]